MATAAKHSRQRFVLEAREQGLKLLASWFELGAHGVLVHAVNEGKNENA
jgi:hypothetical protein